VENAAGKAGEIKIEYEVSMEENEGPLLSFILHMDVERSLIELPPCGTPYRMTLGKWSS